MLPVTFSVKGPHTEDHVRLHRRYNAVIDPRDYGATGDGTTDDTAALRAAVAAVPEHGTLSIPDGEYVFSGTLVLTCHVEASGGATFIWAGGKQTAVQIGTDDAGLDHKRFVLPRLHRQALAWPGDGIDAADIGVRVVNAKMCELRLNIILGFSVGLWLTDTGGRGCAYNTVFPGHLNHNAINLRIAAAPGGWVNQNLFLGGRLEHWAQAEQPVAGTRQIEILYTGGQWRPDENNFFGTCVEGAFSEYQLYTEGSDSTFHSLRWERAWDGSGPALRFANYAHHNLVVGGQLLHPHNVTHDPGTVHNVVQPRENAHYLRSPNGALYRVTVGDDGVLMTEKATMTG